MKPGSDYSVDGVVLDGDGVPDLTRFTAVSGAFWSSVKYSSPVVVDALT